MFAVTLFLANAVLAQQGRIANQGGNSLQGTSGSLAAARNLEIKTEFGSVRVLGGSTAGINYVFHGTGCSEERARRQSESIRISAGVHGDTAYITAEDE